MAFLRTTIFLASLTAILLAIGFFLAGISGITIALLFSVFLNFFAYFYSDKIIIASYGAQPFYDEKVEKLLEEICSKANIRKPRLYLIDSEIPNAFATGRNAKNSAIVITRGLLKHLDEEEIKGVFSHEIAHIKNKDILIATISATIAGAISYLAHLAWYTFFYDEKRNALFLPLILLAPIAAMLIQLAISRTREFHADYTGAVLTRSPLALASALKKISEFVNTTKISGNPATSHLWIVNPFETTTFAKLFSTHPPVEERIKRLEELSKKI